MKKNLSIIIVKTTRFPGTHSQALLAKVGVALILMILIVCSLNRVIATNVQDLNSQQEEIKRQKEEADKQLEEVKNNLSETMLSIEELHQKIVKKEEEIKVLNSNIEEVAKNIKVAEQNLKEAQTSYEKQKKMTEARLIAIYEAGETSYLDVLLKSSSLSDFISNYYLITEIVQKDTRYAGGLRERKEFSRNCKRNIRITKRKNSCFKK